jgi:hypothetical protein
MRSASKQISSIPVWLALYLDGPGVTLVVVTPNQDIPLEQPAAKGEVAKLVSTLVIIYIHVE